MPINKNHFNNFVTGLTFDDVLLKPGYSEVVPAETQTKTGLTKNLFSSSAQFSPMTVPSGSSQPFSTIALVIRQ